MSQLFRNSSPGALTRDQAVALEKRRAAERRKAAQLARQGRGGDTEIAHLTVGEIVLPQMLQTPGVLNALRQAAVEANIPLERLRVGSSRNSINPNTGMPEFTYGDVEDENITRNPVAEQQVADLYINRFPGVPGHVGIGFDPNQTMGFYPEKWRLATPADVDVPGVVKADSMDKPHDTLRIPTSPDQDAAVDAYIKQRQSNPGDYNLYNRQCTDFVNSALRAGNVEIPSSITNTSINQIVPNRFFPLLRQRYER